SRGKKRSAARGTRLQSIMRDVDLDCGRAGCSRLFFDERLRQLAERRSRDSGIGQSISSLVSSGDVAAVPARVDGLGLRRDWNFSGASHLPGGQRDSEYRARSLFDLRDRTVAETWCHGCGTRDLHFHSRRRPAHHLVLLEKVYLPSFSFSSLALTIDNLVCD